MKKIIIALSLSCCLTHAGSNGALDTTFNPTPSALPGQPGGEGIPVADFQGAATFSDAFAVVVDGNGKIVSAGFDDADGGRNSFCIIRLNDNGSLDNTLNNAGAFLGVPGIETIWTASFGASSASASGIALLSDGRIVVGGQVGGGSPTMAAVLLTPLHGALDTTFNPNPPNQYPGVPGIESIPTASFGSATSSANCTGVAVQSIAGNDLIVLAGFANPTGSGGTGSMSVVRLTTTGGLDPSFNASHALIGNPGAATIPIADFPAGAIFSLANAVVVQPDQKIVIAGTYFDAGGNQHWAVARFTTAGALDGTFGGVGGAAAGITAVPDSTFGGVISNQATAVALQTIAGVTKIIVAGNSNSSATKAMTIVRLNPNGAIDTTFNAGSATPGAVIVPLSAFNPIAATDSFANGVQVQSDGKIVVAGGVDTSTQTLMAAVRLTVDGTLDPSFNPTSALPGTPGAETIPLAVTAASSTAIANAVTLDTQSRIVLADRGNTNGTTVFNFVRLSSPTPALSGPISPLAAAIIANYC